MVFSILKQSEFEGIKEQKNLQLPEGCKAFGRGASQGKVKNWLETWNGLSNEMIFFLVIAGSRTAEVEGISSAGSTSLSRRYTALADAEFLLNGPSASFKWPLPPLPAGITPALISYVACCQLGLEPLIMAAGLLHYPSFRHISLEKTCLGPSNCLSTGYAMPFNRVDQLWQKGFSIGLTLKKPLILAECVPGGTTTAQAVLNGLGMSIDGLISGSVKHPPLTLKSELVKKGLHASGLGERPKPKNLLSAIGDPFQPFAAGLLLGARQAGQPVLLGGGSQMLAVLALSLAELEASNRESFVEGISIATTAWLAEEVFTSTHNFSPLKNLFELVGDFFKVPILGLSSGLHFHQSKEKVLRDYELGYIKEGVGAGALTLLAQINGTTCKEIIDACEKVIFEMRGNIN